MSFSVIPAIDLIEGKCVRLTQGDYATKKVYHEDPLEMAKSFEAHGVTKLHLVDLDGAKASRIINYKVIERIASKTNLSIDFGGGLKSDEDLKIAKLYNMLPAEEKADSSRTAINNATVRSVFLIDPDKKIRMMLTYPMTTGRNFEEILRVLDSVQLTSKHKVATPANWKKNDKVIIVPALSDDEAKNTFGEFEKIKPYLRFTKLDDS